MSDDDDLPASAYDALGIPPEQVESLRQPLPEPAEDEETKGRRETTRKRIRGTRELSLGKLRRKKHADPPPASELPGDVSPNVLHADPLPASERSEEASPNVLHADPLPASELSENSSSITIYAEVLLNIRTLTLFASLRSAHNHATKAKLSTKDCSSITISHEGECNTIRLPMKVKGSGSDATLDIPAEPPSKEISLRLQLEQTDGDEIFTGLHAENRKVNLVPWDGASLNKISDLRVLCKSCGEVVLDGRKISEWRDLPNENWAEMMDFWHCHKPDEHHLHGHTHDEAVSKKGYSAGSRLKATSGIGFVDLSSLLLNEQDCEGVQLSPENHASLTCKHCKHSLGITDLPTEGWRLWKWSINIINSSDQSSSPSNKTSNSSSYTIQKWISARLLYLIENQGVRKFHVHPDTSTSPSPSSPPSSSSPGLLLWVFTPDLYFSSSIHSPNRHDPTRAMKIFFKPKPWKVLEPGEPEEVGVEDVVFTEEVYEALKRGLRESQDVLPVNARVFQGWEVGLLERFDVGEVLGVKGDGDGDGDGVEKVEKGVGELDIKD